MKIPEKGVGGVVLLADDEEIVRRSTARLLGKFGFEVILAANGKEAVQLFGEHRDRIALVILDMIMPVMDGDAAFQAIKKNKPDIKVLITSGMPKEDRAQKLLRDGAIGFLQKPFDAKALTEEVTKHISWGKE